MGFNANTIKYEGFVASSHNNKLKADTSNGIASVETSGTPADVRAAVPYAIGSAAMDRPMWAVDVMHSGPGGLVVGHDPDVLPPGTVSRAFVDELLDIDPELLEKLKASIDSIDSRQVA